jgi:hypothetical protein
MIIFFQIPTASPLRQMDIAHFSWLTAFAFDYNIFFAFRRRHFHAQAIEIAPFSPYFAAAE